MIYDYLVPVSFVGPWTLRNMMMMMTTEITLVLSGYHARGLEAIPAKCAVGGNLYTLYTLLSSHSNEMLLKSYFLLSLKVACSVCDFLILKHLLISQKSWCHSQINMEVWKKS